MTETVSPEVSTPAQEMSQRISQFFGGGACFLLAKGRVGLYAGLRALDLPRGSKVLMPGYTCMVVPSAVQFAGLTPVYVDIDPKTYNLNPALLDAAAPPDATAIIVQHTYGIPCEMAAIEAWASGRKVTIIEDSCHAFGSRVNDRLCGTFGAFSFMSGQWNKPFSTGLGGMLLVNEPALAKRIARLMDLEAKRPGWFANAVLMGQIAAHDVLVRPSTVMMLTALYRALNRMGLMVGSSTAGELRGVMPAKYLSTMAACQIRRGIGELARIEANIRHRTDLTNYYDRELPPIGFTPLNITGAETFPLLRYPLRVSNKAEVLRRAAGSGVEIGSWFEIPLHPAGTHMEDFGYRQGMCPESERACRETINLPAHLGVSRRTADKVLTFLRRYAVPA
ncbi:MAG: hypothetical protein HN919_06940 [Verrucomicrobia bacterium]|jgi:perosamine synthetase|nr:hypothetical protein [Verrucomicrobiota bacterium]MBT7701375.1 hypothetical protein [Verrucomicrobiota bacterium]